MSEPQDIEFAIEARRRDDRPLVWRFWWAYVWRPICRVVHALPIAEWRKSLWLWRADIWAMDHIGRIKFR